MAIVSPCVYDARGRLKEVDALALLNAKTRLYLDSGRVPTFEAGSVHVHTVSSSGVTPEHARERVAQELRRFFERAETVRGYRKLHMSRSEGMNRVNLNTTITYEIVYVVEDAAHARSHSPESPYAGYRRERGVAPVR